MNVRRSRSCGSRAGDRPAVRTAESPAPSPSLARPLLSMLSVIAALAVTAGWRVTVFVTPVPSLTRLVATAQAARVTQTSFQIICESPT